VDDSEISRQVEEKVRALTASADAMAPPTADTQRYRTPAPSRAPSSSTLSSTAISSLSIGSSPQHVQKLAQGGSGGSPLTGYTHPPTRLQLAVLFFEKRPRKAWFGKTDADVCWEQWVLTTTVTWPQTDRERSQERAVSSAQLRRVLGEIIARCEEHREHVPIITTSEVNPFPFQVGPIIRGRVSSRNVPQLTLHLLILADIYPIRRRFLGKHDQEDARRCYPTHPQLGMHRCCPHIVPSPPAPSSKNEHV
jgi:hypothetical protein